jgi:broad specificity phosphatase PhoE
MGWDFERVLLIRHGETEWNRFGRRQGQLDSPLTAAARASAAAVAHRLRGGPGDGLFSSPLGRAMESTEFISAAIGLAATVVYELAEVDHGDFAGLTNAQIEERYPGELTRRRAEFYTWRFPGGESYQDADVRAGVALAKVQSSASSSPVLVTHEMIGRMLFRHLLGLGTDEALSLSMDQRGDLPAGSEEALGMGRLRPLSRVGPLVRQLPRPHRPCRRRQVEHRSAGRPDPGMEFTDLDAVAGPFYEQAGQPLQAFRTQIAQVGYPTAARTYRADMTRRTVRVRSASQAPTPVARRRPSAVLVNDQTIWPKPDEADLIQSGDDGGQIVVADVASRHDQETTGTGAKEMAVAEVTVLGDHHTIFCIGCPGDLRVGRSVAAGQLRCMDHVVASGGDRTCESQRELGVDQELHVAPRGTIRRIPDASAPNSSAASRSSRSRSG